MRLVKSSAIKLLILLAAPNPSFSFVVLPSSAPHDKILLPLDRRIVAASSFTTTNNRPNRPDSSALHMVASSGSIISVSRLSAPLIRRAVLVALGAAALLIGSMRGGYKRLLWPGSSPDPNLSEHPLPPGSMGCPWIGHNMMTGTHEYGPYVFFDRAKKKLGNPNLFKFYAFGAPIISVKGTSNIKQVLQHEFDYVNTIMMSEPMGALFGDENILYEQDKTKHGLLRRLAGAAMTPVAVAKGVPAIQTAAQDQIEKILRQASDTPIKMENICNGFTLDVAWRQILGLDLKPEEVPVFHKAVKNWIEGFWNPLLFLPFKVPGLQWTKGFKARKYLVSLVERKLEDLDRNGPDNSTLSGLYFAKDEDYSEFSLTHKQVIDNALILILAGSETTASTLTVIILLLGLHPNVWQKLKDEQQKMRSKYGEEITKQSLDEECPYLDAVIREALRLRPVQTTEIRNVASSIVVDGKQIPKNWKVLYNVRATHEDDPVTKEKDDRHMDVKDGFKPERWLDPSTKPSEWMPFGDGPRRCLGERLSLTEMKVFLSMLARQVDDFDLVADEIKWKKMSVMSKPLDGVEIVVKQQQAMQPV